MGLVRDALIRASKNRWIEDQFRRRRFSRKAVSRFMPGETLEDALREARAMAPGVPVIFTALGENISTDGEADAVRDHYLRVLEAIREAALDVHVSVKPTQLGLDRSPGATLDRLRALGAAARAQGSFLWMDMEESRYLLPTLDLYLELRRENPGVGVCLQSYLRSAESDLNRVLDAGGTVRLVKGAYREPAAVAFPRKVDTDQQFFRMGCALLRHAAATGNRHGLGTHDLTLIGRIRAWGAEAGLRPDGVEVQMLYGIRRREQGAMAREGIPVRVLISYGESWFPWYVRRLAERPANLAFVARSMMGL